MITETRETLSICDICHQDCSATLVIAEAVTMKKLCSCGHTSESMVEPNAKFYKLATSCPSGIYSGVLIDVTDACNIQCKVCYHGGNGDHKDTGEILAFAEKHKDLSPFILSGGEPTLHPEITTIYSKLSEMGRVSMLTNGTFAIQTFEKLGNAMIKGGQVMMALSMHPESDGADFECLDYFRKRGEVLESVLCVVQNSEDVLQCLSVLKPYKDSIGTLRIKAATNSGETIGIHSKFYMSDMLSVVANKYNDFEIYPTMAGKYRYFNAKVEGQHVAFMRWPELHNIDLMDLRDTPPFYMAKDGNLYNLAESLVRNQLHV